MPIIRAITLIVSDAQQLERKVQNYVWCKSFNIGVQLGYNFVFICFGKQADEYFSSIESFMLPKEQMSV